MAQGETHCTWTQDGEGDHYETSCGEAFSFIDDGPTGNGMKFCCYCGLQIISNPYSDPPEEAATQQAQDRISKGVGLPNPSPADVAAPHECKACNDNRSAADRFHYGKYEHTCDVASAAYAEPMASAAPTSEVDAKAFDTDGRTWFNFGKDEPYVYAEFARKLQCERDAALRENVLLNEYVNRTVSLLGEAALTEEGLDAGDATELMDAVEKHNELTGRTTDWHRNLRTYDDVCKWLGIDNGDEINVWPLVEKALLENAELRKPRWTCYHCGESFTDKALASHHFGPDEEFTAPGCVDRLNNSDKELRAQLVDQYRELEATRDSEHELQKRAETAEASLAALKAAMASVELPNIHDENKNHFMECPGTWIRLKHYETLRDSATTQIAALTEKLPCGHWARDHKNPDGTCAHCAMLLSYEQQGEELEKVSAQLAEAQRDAGDARRYRFVREGRDGTYNRILIYALSALDNAIDNEMQRSAT